LLAASVFVIASSAFLLYSRGVGDSAKLFADWLAAFSQDLDNQAWTSPFLAFGRYEPVALFIGLIALIWALFKRQLFTSMLVFWLFSAILLVFLQSPNMTNLLVLTIPAFLLVGRFVNEILRPKSGWQKWPTVGIVLLAGAIFYFNLVRFSRLADLTDTLSMNSRDYHAGLVLLALLLAAILIVVIWMSNRAAAKQGVILGLILVLLFYTWGTAWWLTRYGANDTRERLISSATDDELPLLAETVREISWQATNSEKDLQIISTIDSPVLRWYLRDLTDVEVGAALPRTIDSQALITGIEGSPILENDYIGADFGFYRPDTVLNFDPTESIFRDRMIKSLRWWLFHQSPVIVNEERLILWLRADLAGVNP
jgi:hypothetical protein